MIASRRASDLRKLNRRYPCRFQREDIAYGWLAHGPAARFEFPQSLGRKDFMAGHIARFDRRANRRQAGSAGRTAPYSRNVPRNVPASRDYRRSKQTSSPTIEGASALGCLTPLALSASALPINANDLWLAHKSRTKRPPNPLSTCPQKPRLFR